MAPVIAYRANLKRRGVRVLAFIEKPDTAMKNRPACVKHKGKTNTKGVRLITSDRHFNVIDAMILVAATSIGLAWCVFFERSFPNHPGPPVPQSVLSAEELRASPFDELIHREPVPQSVLSNEELRQFDRGILLHKFFRYSTFFLIVWTVGFLVLRLRNPHLSLHRLVRSPGVTACTTVLIVLIVKIVETLTQWGTWHELPWPNSPLSAMNEMIKGFGDVAGPSVVATWLILIVNRRFRFQGGWLEVLGLLLGIAWILLLFEGAVVWVAWSMAWVL